MKYLKILVGLLLLLTLIFLGRGLLTSSVSYESEILVDKSIEEAWEVMQDETKVTEWLKDITDVKHIRGEKGKVGAVTEYTFLQAGQESKVIETINSVTPQQQIQMSFEAPGAMNMEYKVDFVRESNKTKIKSTTEVTGQGFAMKCLIPWIQGNMLTQEEQNLKNLQEVINRNSTNYFLEPEPTAAN